MQKTPLTAARPFRVFHSDEGIVVAETANVCVVIWRGAVTRIPFEKQSSGLAMVVDRHPGNAGFLVVIEPTTKPPEDELRRASTQMLQAHGDRLNCVACVIEGQGFRASVARGVVSGMLLMTRHRHSPVSFPPNVRAGATWMSEYVRIPSVDALTSTVEEIRARILPSPDKR
jgi:hypothetical protein